MQENHSLLQHSTYLDSSRVLIGSLGQWQRTFLHLPCFHFLLLPQRLLSPHDRIVKNITIFYLGSPTQDVSFFETYGLLKRLLTDLIFLETFAFHVHTRSTR